MRVPWRRPLAIGALAALGVPMPVSMTVARAAGVPTLTVKVAVVGRPSAAGPYSVTVACRAATGSERPAFRTSLGADATREISAADIAGLDATDSCVVSATGVDGAQLTYATSIAARADASTPDPLRGVVDATGYHAAASAPSSQTVTVTFTYVGDLLVRKVVQGVSDAQVGLYEVQIRCDGAGISRTVLLGDGQSALVPGIPTGTECSVEETRGDGASPRFDDNNGDPNDGRVTIVSTPATCWDLRATGPDCRAVVTVTNRFRSPFEPVPSVRPGDVSTTTTTSPEDQSRINSPATTAAPAVTAEPASAVEQEPTFTG